MPPRGAMMPKAPKPPKDQTVEWRAWKGVNRTDSRTDIEDEEFSWLENFITVGKGALQGLPGAGANIATIAAGPVSAWGFTLSGSPVIITVNADGSMSQVAVPGGAVTAVGAAATVTTAAHLAIWQGSPILIIDPVKGYMSWDGTTLTVIDAATLGRSIAVFEGRVWIGNNRTIKYTAPNTFNSFVAGDGAGSAIITDEAFQGNIIALVSALEELWIIGQSAIEALANVTAAGTAPNVLTSFSITNIVTNLGSNAGNSALGYLRALAFFAPFGAYALSGVTPQKLSAKLDGLLPDLTLTGDVPAAVAVVQNLLALLFLTTYTGTNAQAGSPPIQMVLGFVEGKWFFAVQRTALKWITSVVVGGVAQCWGTDGSGIYQLFGAALTTSVTGKVQSKLFPLGNSVDEKAMTKVGLEIQALNGVVAPTFTVDSEVSSETITAAFTNSVTWINSMSQVVQWINSLSQPVNWVSQGTVLARATSAQFGHYLGWTLAGTDPPYRLQAVAFEYHVTRKWSTP